jgi:hypothetical protein
LTLHTSTVGNHAILVLTTPDGHVAIVEGVRGPADGSATFTSFDGRAERAAFDVDSDPL